MRRRPLAAAAALCVAMVASCTTGGGDSTGAGRPDRLTVLQSFPFTSMNPLVDPARPATRISGLAVETATKFTYDKAGPKLVPWLVTEWKQEEPTRWRFTVRPDVTFGNGEKLTAEAFRFTLKTTLAAERSGGAVVFRDMAIDVVDDLHFDVRTPEPNGILPAQMAYFFVLPPKYYAQAGAEKYGMKPVGTGPYTVSEVKQGVSVALRRNEKYWGDAPKIRDVSIRVVSDPATRVAELERGSADIIEAVPPVLRERVERIPTAEVARTGTNVRMFLLFNSHTGNTRDLKVRRAVSHAVDRDAIVEGIFKGEAKPLRGIFVEGEDGYRADTAPDFAPDEARRLVRELGGKLKIKLYATSKALPMDSQIIQTVQEQLREAGIESEISTGTPQAILRPFYAGQHEGAALTQLGLLYPDSSQVFGNYFTGYAPTRAASHDPGVEELAAEAFRTADRTRRTALYEQAQDAVAERRLWVPLVALTDVWGIGKGIDWSPRPDQMYEFGKASRS